MKTYLLTAGLIAAAMAARAEPAMIGDAIACAPGAPGPAVLVSVTGFKNREGQTMLKLYSDRDDEFLKSPQELVAAGKLFQRLDTPTPPAGDALFCMKLPGQGRYTMSVLHDRNGDGEVDVWKDGFGFSNNPKLGFGTPKAASAAFTAGPGVLHMKIVLNYVVGLMPQPLKNPH